MNQGLLHVIEVCIILLTITVCLAILNWACGLGRWGWGRRR